LGVICLLFSAACGTPPPRDPNIIAVVARVGPNNLNPLKANDEGTARVSQLMFESLMDIGEDLRPQPRLIERLETPDPVTYIAHLRRGIRFHDGHELTSKDVVFTFAKFLDPEFLSPYKGAFTVLASVRPLDDHTVEFKLKEPFAAFPLANLVPVQVVPAGSAEGDLSRFPIGTGPYRFVRYDVDDKVIMAAFEGYWDGAPSNAGVEFRIVPDDTMRSLELRKGTADLMINDIPPDIVHQFETSGDFRVTREPGLDFSYLGFNMRDPLLADKRVRHAIGYAINREAIVKYLRRGLAQVATGLIPPQAWAYEPDIHTFNYDPARAMRLLDEAGHPDPDGPNGPLPRLNLSLKISTNEETRLQSTVIQQDLQQVGINLDLRSYEFATMFADVLKGNFQLMSLTWVGGAMVDPDILRRVFHSSQVPPAGFNRGHYSNPEVDRLIDIASMAIGEADRKQAYGAAQKIIADDAPYIPIWNRTNVIVSQPTLDRLHVNPVGDFRSLKDVRRIAAP
jgi:peptide/nickel transport system substrate-binding protein